MKKLQHLSKTHPVPHREPWQTALAGVITDPAELLEMLALDAQLLPAAQKAARLFGLRVPRGFLTCIEKGNPNDPVLRQILPLGTELQEMPEYLADPLQERVFNPLPGLLHKYYGRVLLTVTGACGVHCRYCFRRAFPYEANNPGQAGWQQAAEYIRARPEITEIILSGGDPLVATDKYLDQFTQKLRDIAHIKTLRFHTRMPVIIPERLTSGFLGWLQSLPWRKVMILHCNHANELMPELLPKIQKLQRAGVTVLNQAVLLKGVNDTREAQIALSEKLMDYGILPYYLHMLDKVVGASHFAVPDDDAARLYADLQAHLPGYLVPRLVREIPHAKNKVLFYNSLASC